MRNVALVGNPNSGKTSLFNALTGLRQKTGNYPGVTVEKISGKVDNEYGEAFILQDFPGAYSLHPTSYEEKIVTRILADPQHEDFPDLIIYVVDIQQLDKQLLLFSQVMDLGIPVILALNMADLKDAQNFEYDARKLEELLKIPVVEISGRTGHNLTKLKKAIFENLGHSKTSSWGLKWSDDESMGAIKSCRSFESKMTDYQLYLQSIHDDLFDDKNAALVRVRKQIKEKMGSPVKLQVEETLRRFRQLENGTYYTLKPSRIIGWSERIDPVVTHPIIGPILFLALMFLVFQLIYTWAAYPMDWIEQIFDWSSFYLASVLPSGWFQSLLLDGVVPGIAGVLVFVPQIALLFLLISFLEESGYMARAAYLLDSLMQRFGMSGRSLVALISGGACAIPAIISTRNISSPKERLITILVVPFIGCSARLPIYTIMIGFAVPPVLIFGLFDARALLFLSLYLLGAMAALFGGLFLKYLLKVPTDPSMFIIELPEYKIPDLWTVFLNVWNKTKTFIYEAGKIIFFISMILWLLASYGPNDSRKNSLVAFENEVSENSYSADEKNKRRQAYMLESSYIGIVGQWIEPVIRPLGFDWKIGIGLITSFAAREVFVGTMATIYSIGDQEDGFALRERMREERMDHSGERVYTYATALSLLIFYVLAMQCMSTLTVVYKETGHWKYPAIQFITMTLLAYLGSFATYQLVSNL
jgi:ferrous iron transport protein B